MEFEYTDIENVEDISDVYADEVVSEILESMETETDPDEVAALDTSSGDSDGSVYVDMSELISSFDSYSESLDSVSEQLADIMHTQDETKNFCIVIMFLVAAFVVINIVRKLFDVF